MGERFFLLFFATSLAIAVVVHGVRAAIAGDGLAAIVALAVATPPALGGAALLVRRARLDGGGARDPRLPATDLERRSR